MRRAAALAIALLALVVAAAGYQVSQPSAVDPPVLGPAVDPTGAVDVTSDGPHFSAFWANLDPAGTVSHARFLPDAAVLDQPAKTLIAPAPGDVGASLQAASGANGQKLVVWVRDATAGRFIDAVLLDVDGNVLLGPKVIAGPVLADNGTVSVASDGTDYLVVYDLGPGITGQRITSAGVLRDPGGYVIDSSPSAELPAVASSGNGFFVAWSDVSATLFVIWSARLATVMPVIAITPRASLYSGAGQPGFLRLGFDGTRFALLFGLDDSLSSSLAVRRVDTNGTQVGSLVFFADAGTGDPWRGSVAGSNGGFLIGYSQAASSSSATVGWAGLRGFDGMITSQTEAPGGAFPAVARSASGGTVVFSYPVTNAEPSRVMEVPVDGQGAATGPQSRVDYGYDQQRAPAATASSASTAFVVWTQATPTQSRVRGRRVGGAGPPPANAFVAFTGPDDTVAIATNAMHHLVVWPGTTQLFARRVVASSATQLVEQLQLSQHDGGRPPAQPAVASNGDTWLVAWLEGENLAPQARRTRVYAALVDASGVVGVPRLLSGTNAGRPSVAAVGTEYLVGWDTVEDDGGAVIRLQRLSAAGVPLGMPGIPTANGYGPVSVGSQPNGAYQVLWTQPALDRVEVRQYSSTGFPLNGTPLGMNISFFAPVLTSQTVFAQGVYRVALGGGDRMAFVDFLPDGGVQPPAGLIGFAAPSYVDLGTSGLLFAETTGRYARVEVLQVTYLDDGGMMMVMPDAGTPDAGTPDAGVSDAGTSQEDAGTAGDGGTEPMPGDAGEMMVGTDAGPGLPRVLAAGCGCDSSGAPLLFAAAAAVRALRRRSCRTSTRLPR